MKKSSIILFSVLFSAQAWSQGAALPKIQPKAPVAPAAPIVQAPTPAPAPAKPAAAATAKLACQSQTLCLHDKMPLYRQGTAAIRDYISQAARIPKNKIVDTFCSPTSTSMVLKTMQLERGETLKKEAYLNSSNENEIIYNIMRKQNSSFTGGGTSISAIFSSINNIAASLGFGAVSNGVTLPSEAAFRQSIPLIVSTVQLNFKGYHTVAINGFDGGYVKIFDPAGRIYNLSKDRSQDGVYHYAPGNSPGYKYTGFNNSVSLSSYMPGQAQQESQQALGFFFRR